MESSVSDCMNGLGFGWYQVRTFLLVGAVVIADGMEMVCMTLVSETLRRKWKLTPFEVGFMGSAVFIGFLIGSLAGGKLADKYGRRPLFLYASVFLFISGTATAFAPNYIFFVLVRSFVGVTCGIAMPIGFSLCTELNPTYGRGFRMCIFSNFFAVGELFEAALAYFVLGLNPVEPKIWWKEEWRWFLVATSAPCLCALPFLFWLLPESPHYLEVSGRREELERMLREIAVANKAPDSEQWLHPTEVKGKERDRSDRGTLLGLLTDRIAWTTIPLWVLWFCQSYLFYGSIYILPGVMDRIVSKEHLHTRQEFIYMSIGLAALADIPGSLISAYAIDSTVGRKKTIAVCSLLAALALGASSATITSANPNNYALFAVSVLLAKMFINSTFTTVYPFTSEIYPTTHRAVGLGTCSAASRVGGIITPTLSELLLNLDDIAPYLSFAVIAVLSGLSAMLIPRETAGQDLSSNTLGDGDVEKAPLIKSVNRAPDLSAGL